MKQQGFRRLLVWLIAKPNTVKTKLLLPTVLLFAFATANTFAQIPNNGFENWGTFNGFDNPNGWYGIGANGNGSYSIHKNLDNYPSETGSFSVLIKSDIAQGVFGQARTGNVFQLEPVFPITGHPTSLTGYYKFLPINGDTMNIAIVLFQGGAIVAYGVLRGVDTISNWTSFNVPISSYTTADSAYISLSSCNFFSVSAPVPQGNSVLYVDNLSFDVLITGGISEVNDLPTNFRLDQNYPNPFNGGTVINFFSPAATQGSLKIYDVLGREVAVLASGLISAGEHRSVWNPEHFASGIYIAKLEMNGTLLVKKMMYVR